MYGLYECVFPDMYISPDMDTSLLSRPPQWKLITSKTCLFVRLSRLYQRNKWIFKSNFLAILVQP